MTEERTQSTSGPVDVSLLVHDEIIRHDPPVPPWRHVEATRCSHLMPARDGDRHRPALPSMPCGWRAFDAIHDMHPEVSKRDRLYGMAAEFDRHAYEPAGIGVCAADDDEWPCRAERMRLALQDIATIDDLARVRARATEALR